jgi:hypothetical protein
LFKFALCCHLSDNNLVVVSRHNVYILVSSLGLL